MTNLPYKVHLIYTNFMRSLLKKTTDIYLLHCTWTFLENEKIKNPVLTYKKNDLCLRTKIITRC